MTKRRTEQKLWARVYFTIFRHQPKQVVYERMEELEEKRYQRRKREFEMRCKLEGRDPIPTADDFQRLIS